MCEFPHTQASAREQWGRVEGIGTISCGDRGSGIGVAGASLLSRKPLNTACLAESIYTIYNHLFPLSVSIASVQIIAPVLHSLLAQILLFAAGLRLDIFISGKEGSDLIR